MLTVPAARAPGLGQSIGISRLRVPAGEATGPQGEETRWAEDVTHFCTPNENALSWRTSAAPSAHHGWCGRVVVA